MSEWKLMLLKTVLVWKIVIKNMCSFVWWKINEKYVNEN